MKIKKATIIRTILLIVAIINRFLTTKGITFIVDETLAGYFADIFIAITGIAAFWYNNSFTKNAIAADNYLADLRGVAEDDEEDEV
jgi:SPP1 family holin